MTRFLGLFLVATTTLSTAALAATPERIRGTVTAITADAVTVHSTDGTDKSIALTGTTRFSKIVRASLTNVEPGSYIGTATKEVGGKLIALEVVLFPPAMKGAGEGHYGWDRIPDTTLAGGASASSTMTNGTVSTAAATAASANTTMTNGNVSAADTKGGAKQLTVTYKGGEQSILVPPTAPVVSFAPGAVADVTKGTVVFINASNDDGKLTANSVSLGSNGVNPPM
jgi:hypothetical protein